MSGVKKTLIQRFFEYWIPLKTDSKKKKQMKITCFLILLVLLVCFVLLFLIFLKYLKPTIVTNTYSDLYSLQTSSKDDEKSIKKDGINKSFDKLIEVNKDSVGFICIKNTKLAYPVVKGVNNSFYIDKSLYKQKSTFGIPFADYRAKISNDYQSTNITIYGHSSLDGAFFSTVKNYKDINFYKQNPTFIFNTIKGDAEYKVVAFFIEDVNPSHGNYFNYHDFVDPTDDKHTRWFIENSLKRSYFKTPVDIELSDKFVTLSTCDTDINKSDFRAVLVGRKIRENESNYVDVQKAIINKEQIMPKLWQEKKQKKNSYS